MACETCAGQDYDGILWPISSDGCDAHDFIERCDTCDLYSDDLEAALYVGRMEGRDISLMIRTDSDDLDFFPYLDRKD